MLAFFSPLLQNVHVERNFSLSETPSFSLIDETLEKFDLPPKIKEFVVRVSFYSAVMEMYKGVTASLPDCGERIFRDRIEMNGE